MAINKRRKVLRDWDPDVKLQWFDDSSEEDEQNVIEDDDEADEDFVIVSDHDSLSEQEISDSGEREFDDDRDNTTENYYLGKNGEKKWRKKRPPLNVRTRSHNIITHLPGPKGVARAVQSEIEALSLFIDIMSSTLLRLLPTFISSKLARNLRGIETPD